MSDTTKNPGGRPRRGVVAGKIAASAIDENATATITPEEAEAAHIEPADAGDAVEEAPLSREELLAELRQELAAEQEAERLAEVAAAPVDANRIVVHFVDDGFTFLGKVWYRGETLTIVEGTENWKKVHDVNGNTVLNYDVYDQEARYGKEYFRPGPWRGKGYVTTDPDLTAEDRAALARANGTPLPSSPKKATAAAPGFLAGGATNIN